ncbi:MAG: endonuclease MutS2 [Candidatus Acetothermia bacterium]|jgi:DNA mismatch repair protein MutS2|nr:endonuclease MutS2 [Candidatus Acetothermia bacterium]MDH7504799.1 endonuclease MutS2 [Candidatus Acetothermia bacterium]
MEVANERTLRDLEYAKVKEIISGYATSPLGREWILRLEPSANPAVIRIRLERVEELRRLLEEQPFSLGPIHDLRPVLEEARQSTSLAPEEFLPILETLRTARLTRERLLRLTGFPRLAEIAQGIAVFRELEENIARTIDEQGQLKDGASSRLRELTDRRRAVEERVKTELEQLLQSPAYASMVQDTVVARRGGRLTVPIKAGAKHLLDWVVQDSSESGQTLYVEPPAVVEGNNELRELEGEIREERLRVLKELTARLKLEERKLLKTLRALGMLDALYAQARYGQELRCTSPRLNSHGRLSLLAARHPLLPQRTVVPIDLSFGASSQGVLITGPNTGGKTVTLKTVGLLTLLAQSGLQIPASPDSELAIFKRVRSDIGSEESIEQSLSTFSSHMRNIIEILREVDGETLVLLDELGAGTDPQEGAALGIAILRYLLLKGAKLAVTTHFSALKRFAYLNPRLKTCSVEFDVETLSPTFRLLEGVGASNALIVAERLGLSREIVEEAKRTIPEGEVRVEEIIRDLQQERSLIRAERQRLEEQLREAARLRAELEDRLRRAREEKESALSAELQQVEALLRETRRALEGALHQAREEAAARQALQETLALEQGLKAAAERLAAQETGPIRFEELREGERVFLQGAEKVAVVRKIAGPERIELDLAGVRIWAKLADLRCPPEEPVKEAVRPRLSYELHARPEVKLELSVHGLTVVEALSKVDRYLDQLLLAEMSRGYIIHGKGTGALRRAIREHLKELPFVKAFYPAPPREGGDGVTVVELETTA